MAVLIARSGGTRIVSAREMRTGTSTSAKFSLGGLIKGAAIGFISGGPAGAVAGGVAGSGLVGGANGGGQTKPGGIPLGGPAATMTGITRSLASTKCQPGQFRMGTKCVDPFAAGPGGKPFITEAPGVAVMGAFGLPAMQPAQVGTITRNDGTVAPILRCGRRMVLGHDNLCYPKALLGRRSRFRKWRLPSRPPVTGGDMQAIRRAARTRDRVKELAGDVGFTCAAKGAKRRKK